MCVLLLSSFLDDVLFVARLFCFLFVSFFWVCRGVAVIDQRFFFSFFSPFFFKTNDLDFTESTLIFFSADSTGKKENRRETRPSGRREIPKKKIYET